ncbi:outer membrane beta-barrel protein [Pedobacter agri]|uniref:outer membrane beta-barrel protein n=1 Tax=Pedobacter agri TaxID=454586 RepID=UPI002930A9FE|nr:outer membrane beta-barrel protein [Pedobacter agri]
MKKLELKSLNQFIKFPNKSKFSIICLISSIVFTIPELSMAQARFSVHAGANFSKVIISHSNSNFQEYDFNPGQVGLSVEIPFANKIFLQPSVSYIQKGFKSPNAGYFGYQTDFVLRADYLEVPILVLFKPNLVMENS